MYNRSYRKQKKKIFILGPGRQRKLIQDVGEKVSHNIKIMLQKKIQLGSLNALVSLHCKRCCRQYFLLFCNSCRFQAQYMMFSLQVSNQDIHTENPPMVSGSGMGPIAKSHMGRYSSSSFFFPHEHQLQLLV